MATSYRFSRRLLSLMLLVLLAEGIFAQSDSQTTRSLARTLDFGPVWMRYNSTVLGFIGPNYQRIRIKFLTIIKDTNDPRLYHVAGKSKVNQNVCRFSGTILISELTAHEPGHFGVDEEYKDSGLVKQGTLEGTYRFAEDSTQPHSGLFEGKLSTAWYIDRHRRLRYDDIESYSDSYSNNEFRGTWIDYKTRKSKVCNWGDFRIPDSGDLDIGAGEFSPDDKYLKYGWQSYHDAFSSHPPDPKARRTEEAKWWR